MTLEIKMNCFELFHLIFECVNDTNREWKLMNFPIR
jgi:hypothetical protein